MPKIDLKRFCWDACAAYIGSYSTGMKRDHDAPCGRRSLDRSFNLWEGKQPFENRFGVHRTRCLASLHEIRITVWHFLGQYSCYPVFLELLNGF